MAQTTIAGVTYNHTQLVKNAMGAIFRNALVCSNPKWTKRGLATTFSGPTPIGQTFEMRNPQRTITTAGTRPIYNVTEQPTYECVISNIESIAHSYLSWEDRFYRLNEAVEELAPELAALASILDLSVTKGQVSTADRAYGQDAAYLMNPNNKRSTGADQLANIYTDAPTQAFGEEHPTASTPVVHGTDINEPFTTFSDMTARMHQQGVNGRYHVFLTPRQSAQCAKALRRDYNPQRTISRYFDSGSIEMSKPGMGVDTFMESASIEGLGEVNLGTNAQPVALRSQPDDGQEWITLDGIDAAAGAVIFKAGTIITIMDGTSTTDALQSVNFQTRKNTGYQMDYVVTADVIAPAGGLARGDASPVIHIFPPIAAGSETAPSAGAPPAGGSRPSFRAGGSGASPTSTALQFLAAGNASEKNKRTSKRPVDNALVKINGILANSAANKRLINASANAQVGYMWLPGTIGMMFVRGRQPKREEDAFQVELPNEFSASTVKSYIDELQLWTCTTRTWHGVCNGRPEQGGKLVTELG